MKLRASWVEGQDNAVPEERATVADLEIRLGRKNVTAHEAGGERFNRLFVSVYGLAEGLVHEWWRMVGSRDAGISFQDYRDGYILPDVRVVFDGQHYRAWAERFETENPPVRFAASPEVLLERVEFERELTLFIGAVQDRLAAKGLEATPLKLCWDRVMASRYDPDEAAFCEAAGALHLDPYSIKNADRDFIFKSSHLFEGEALQEFLSGVRTVKRGLASKTLDAIFSIKGEETRLADLRAIASETAHSVEHQSVAAPWALGYRKAAEVRRTVLPDQARSRHGRKPEVEVMATWFGAAEGQYAGDKNLVVNALRHDVGDDIHVALRKRNAASRGASRRFAFARAIGDALCYPQGGSAPINEQRYGYRQAAGRAFAAEFLAPLDLVEQMKEDGKSHDKIANDLNVHPEVIYRQLENAKNIRAAIG